MEAARQVYVDVRDEYHENIHKCMAREDWLILSILWEDAQLQWRESYQHFDALRWGKQ